MSEIDLDALITTFDNMSIKIRDDEKDSYMTIGRAITEGLMFCPPTANANGKDKMRRYHLGQKAFNGGMVSFEKHDIDFILKCLEAWATPLIYGRVNEVFENKDS